MDSFEKFIPIIFLIIWILIAVLGKKKKKQAPPPDKEKRPSPATPFDKLQSTFKDLFAELEQPGVEEELPEILEPKKVKIPERKKTKIEKDIEIKLQDTDIKPSPPTPPEIKPSYPTYARSVAKTAIPVKKLQEAVIWSEILGKPVSMRDE